MLRAPALAAARLPPSLARPRPLPCPARPPLGLPSGRAAPASARPPSGPHPARSIAMSSSAGGEGSYTYKWPRPGLTVDALVVAGSEAAPPQLLLIQRKFPPCQGAWALPGGFVDEGEALDSAAARELQEETGVDPSSVTLSQVGAFGDPGRDPRGWTVTVAYAAVVPTELGVKAADDASDAQWFPVGELPPLAFDHKLVVRKGLAHLAGQPHAGGALGKALLAAAGKLEGPWDPPTE